MDGEATAAPCREIEELQAVSAATGRHVMVGLKTMFFPANQHAEALMADPDFGEAMLVTL